MKERLKLILGFSLLPFAYCIWIADRIIYTIIPQSDHPKLTDWLDAKTVVFAIIRVLTFFLIRYIIKWIFGI